MKFNINMKELDKQIEKIGNIGLSKENGIYRGLYTEEWDIAVKEIEVIMKEAGLVTYSDSVGNIFGKVNGTDKENGTILTGSHIDTVLNGGKYDGLLGILAGIAAIKHLIENYGPPKRTIEVVATCEEEGSRFNTSFWGARAILGQIGQGDTEKYYDKQGTKINDAMLKRGIDPQKIKDSIRDDIKAFVELHIEQGGVLEEQGASVGIVEAITGIKQIYIHVSGKANHAGTTPMSLRKDAARTTAVMIEEIGLIAENIGAPAVSTVGEIKIEPGAKNVIPGKATFSVDMRHPDKNKLNLMESNIIDKCKEIANKRGLTIDVHKLVDEAPVIMDVGLVKNLRVLAEIEGVNFHDMVSGAGHDASLFGKELPTAMIFVPSVCGKSHCPEEYTCMEDAIEGIKLLAELLYDLAYN